MPHFDDLPYVFFGHSMGASIAFELSRLLAEQHSCQPRHLIISGRRAPQLLAAHERNSAEKKTPLYRLTKDEFFQRIIKFNGTPDELINHRELMDMMEPALRADFKLIETWPYQQKQALTIPVDVCYGEDDPDINADSAEAWRQQSAGLFNVQHFSGDHFFLHQQRFALLSYIETILKKYI